MQYFDAHLLRLDAPVPPDCIGALIYDQSGFSGDYHAPSKSWRRAIAMGYAANKGRAAIGLAENQIADIRINPEELYRCLTQSPKTWWPLAEREGEIAHLNLPPGARVAAGVRALAGKLPAICFLVDPFVHGPLAGWQAQVRMAERDNIYLTTRGLYPTWPASPGGWSADQTAEAMHFTSGEVGSGKLLFASGANMEMVAVRASPYEWLSTIKTLDAPQYPLILEQNARAVFRI